MSAVQILRYLKAVTFPLPIAPHRPDFISNQYCLGKKFIVIFSL